MKQYEKYKDSGIEWVDDIPYEWKIMKFGQISYMKGRIGWQGLKQSEFTRNEEDPFLITGMNFHDGVIRWNEVYHISTERYNEAPEIQLKEDDVLITKDGTIGKLLYVDKIPAPHKASLNSHLLVLRPLKNSYNQRYLYYQLQSLPFKHHVELTKTGTTFFGISQEAMGQYKMLLPKFEEQQKIATYLDRKTAEIDELIADKKCLLELYEEEKTAIINQAVTKGINPNAPMKDSGIEWLGEIPEHWQRTKLKYVSNKIGDGIHTTPKYVESSDFKFVNGNNLENGEIKYFDSTRSVSEEEFEKHKKEIESGTVLISINGTIGKLAFYNGEKVILGKSAAFIEPTEDIYNKFLFYTLKTNYVITQFNLSYSGSTINNLSLYTLNNLDIVLPEIEEQENIIEYLDEKLEASDVKISRIKRLIELLNEYRTTIISEVVTGKIKVTE